MADRNYRGWRNVDVAALVAWIAVVSLAIVDSATGRRGLTVWCVMAAVGAAVMSSIAYSSRRFDRLEQDAFDRGLKAGMGISWGERE